MNDLSYELYQEMQSYGPDEPTEDDREQYEAWLASLPVGFPEPELTPERRDEIIEACGGDLPF